jgi:hypothetical protein
MTSPINPFADPDHLIDYGLRGRDVVLGPYKPRPPKPPAQPEPGASGGIAVSYKDLEFEPLAYREAGQAEKKLLSFSDSLERLRKAGYERHPLPSEAFGLIIDSLGGKLSPAEKAVADDMLASYGEWLSLAFMREGDILRCYEHPENITRTGQTYDCSAMKSAAEKTVSIKGLPSVEIISVKDVASASPGLVEYIWSRPYDKLPGEIQSKAYLWLREKGPWPVGRGDFVDVRFGGGYVGRASRGVKTRM